MDAVAHFLGSIGAGLFQHASVVADLAAAQAALTETLGCERWVDLPATDLTYEVRGRTVECALAIGFARSGDVQVELIQPVRGPSIHAEFLTEHGPGVHHLGHLVPDLDRAIADAHTAGAPVVMRGAFAPLRFAYVDTSAITGVMTELVEDPDGTMFSIMPWRDAP